MVFHVAVVDDEKSCADVLSAFIARYESENSDNVFRVSQFLRADDFLSSFRKGFDVVFLDIQMPGMNGMDVARKIRQQDENAILVFVTNMAQYALESYEVHAYDFVVKPVSYESFSMKFARIVNGLRHRHKEEEITLVSGQSRRRVLIADITYIEVSNHNLIVHLTTGEYRMRGTISEMERKLAGYHFLRCNSCYLVNLAHVWELKGDYVVVGESELRISHLKKPAFLSEFAKYIGGSI